MTAFKRIKSVKPQTGGNANRITITLANGTTYAVNQSTLNKYKTGAEMKAALDLWMQANLGYVINDIFFHLNDDGTWAIATGQEPLIWPEDEVEP
jgi:hypothetical protein